MSLILHEKGKVASTKEHGKNCTKSELSSSEYPNWPCIHLIDSFSRICVKIRGKAFLVPYDASRFSCSEWWEKGKKLGLTLGCLAVYSRFQGSVEESKDWINRRLR